MDVVHLNQKQLAARWNISEATQARREWNVAGNGQFGRLARYAGFRRNPQQHAGTGANRQEKAPTDNSWGFSIGGGGGN